MRDATRDRTDWWIAAALAAATLAVYGQVAGHAFLNFDDNEYVVANPHVRAGLAAASVRWALTHVHAATWHPLTSLSHMLDVQLLGLHAGAQLLENAVLHALNAVLLFAALRRMTGARWPSALVAALFALHPQHVESVAWVSERKDVLSTLFWMLTLLAYAAYATRPQGRHYLVVVAVFALGLLAKPMLVTLPFVLLLLDYWPLRRLDPAHPDARLLWEKLPLIGLAALDSAVTYYAQQQAGAVVSTAAIPLSARLANALIAYATYLWKTVLPIHLAAFYPLHLPVPAWQTALAGLALVLISAGVLAAARRRPYLVVGWCWYLGTLVPVLGVVKQGEQAMADRFTYVPLIGVFIMLAWGLADLAAARRWPARRLWPAAAAGLAVCAVLSVWQVGQWRDSATLFRHALAVTTDNYLAHVNLGAALVADGRIDEALPHFEEGLRLRPDFVKAHVDVGMALAALGNADAANAAYERALAIDPASALAHYNLGVLRAQQGRLDEAVAEYRAALAANPDYANAHNNLGLALGALGRSGEAIDHYRAALALRPDLAPAHSNLAVALESAGQLDEALAHYQAAVALAPEEPLARLNLGAVLMGRGRIDEAIAQYREALRLRPGLSDAQIALADALARRGAAPPAP
jgi:tetratricopeptide (TPR) repeat protein